MSTLCLIVFGEKWKVEREGIDGVGVACVALLNRMVANWQFALFWLYVGKKCNSSRTSVDSTINAFKLTNMEEIDWGSRFYGEEHATTCASRGASFWFDN